MGSRNGPRKLMISDAELVKLYTKDLVMVQDIAKRYGVARQTVHYRLKQIGIKCYKRKTKHVKCPGCGEMFDHWPTQGDGKYCSRRCYHESTSVHGQYSKAGQREARKVAGAQEGETIHHVDGDTKNNHPSNLLIFKTGSAHMSFHKSGAARLLKEKVEVGEIMLSTKPRERVV